MRGDELGQQLGVLVVGTDGDGVPPRAEDAHGRLLGVGVLASFVTEIQIKSLYTTKDSLENLVRFI